MVALITTSVSRNIAINLFLTLKVPSRLYGCIYGNSQILSLICIGTIARGVCAIQSYITPPRHVCAIPPPRNLSQAAPRRSAAQRAYTCATNLLLEYRIPLVLKLTEADVAPIEHGNDLLVLFNLRPSDISGILDLFWNPASLEADPTIKHRRHVHSVRRARSSAIQYLESCFPMERLAHDRYMRPC